MKIKIYLFLFATILLSSCVDDSLDIDFPTGEVEGYKPVYSEITDPHTIIQEGVQPMRNPGKIVLAGTKLLVNEQYEGIHIIDNADPSAPKQIGFIRIPGNLELSIKGNHIFANNLEDLVSLEVAADGSVTVKDRKSNIFPEYTAADNLISTIPHGAYFECFDDSKGYVIRWEKTTINSPKCYK
ncbi:MAG: hypothetical protein ACPGJS_10135 [Flammeovirgaceae bacterium]